MGITADEVVTQRHKRAFIQFGGPRPGNRPRYGGQDAQYMKIEGVSVPEAGDLNPIWVPDPRVVGRFRLVGRSLEPGDLAEATLVMMERHGAIPRQLGTMGTFNLYEATGACKDLSDFAGGWSDYVLIYSGAVVTDKDLGDRQAWDSDDAIEDSLSITLANIYPVGSLAFGTEATGLAGYSREVIDISFGPATFGEGCGPLDDDARRLYALQQGNGSTLPPTVLYSADGGVTWTGVAITGIGVTELASALAVVGRKLVVVSPTAAGATTGGYYISDLNDQGVPGAFTKVVSGFQANKEPRDVVALSLREVFFCGDGGTVYRSTDLAAGVELVENAGATSADLTRIHAMDDTIVAVGAADGATVSRNRGATWEALVPGSAGALTAVAVLDAMRFWVGDSAGVVRYTLDGGYSWATLTLAGVAAIQDIVFATDEVGYIAATTSTPAARLYTTWNGGADWSQGAPRVLGWPTFNRANRVAVPEARMADVAANNVAIAGLATGGTAGRLLLGVAGRM